MTRLALIRHGPTAYNEDRRMQGRVDEPLSTAGRSAVEGWSLPPDLRGGDWVSSPLIRARETAALLGGPEPAIEPRIIEMDWGQWEGRRLDDLRSDLGNAMAENEARGLDFRPVGGESPRDVQARVAPWLADVGRRGRATLALTHKGVIRAIFALAMGWDMTGKPPAKLARAAAHLFTVAPDGQVAVERLNMPLAGGTEP
jgi:probable phosphoglycerate mutase